MNKHILFFAVALAIIFLQPKTESAVKNTAPENRAQRGLLMFIDETENKFNGALSSGFFSALEQKAGPIIVSSFLFNAFLNTYNSTYWKLKNKSDEFTKNKYLQLVSFVHEAISEKQISQAEKSKIVADIDYKFPSFSESADQQFEAVVVNSSFNPQDWIILDVHMFYLLIPLTYLQKIGIQTSTVNHQLALSLGLNIDKMEKIPEYIRNVAELLTYVSIHQKSSTPNNIIDILNKIFITNSDYYKENQSAMIPEWSIYMTGHGGPNSIVAGIPIAIFPAVLDFFEEKVTTKLLAYDSCYAAGMNTEIIYRDIKKVGMKKIYSYAILTSALTDEVTMATKPRFLHNFTIGYPEITDSAIDWEKKNLTMKFFQDFTLFLTRAFSTNIPIDYVKIIEPIIPVINRSQVAKDRTAAQIRLPGLPWFSVVDAQNKIVSIGDVLAATRGNRPLGILDFFKQQRPSGSSTDLAAILLYTRNIPFMLDMQDIGLYKLPTIIPMIPGGLYKLAGITVTDTVTGKFDSILNTIADIFAKGKLQTRGWGCRTFIIGKILIKDKDGKTRFSVSNVLIDCMQPDKIYFEEDGKQKELIRQTIPSLPDQYRIEIKELPANDSDAILYQQKLRDLRGAYVSSEQEPSFETIAGKLKTIHEERIKKSAQAKG